MKHSLDKYLWILTKSSMLGFLLLQNVEPQRWDMNPRISEESKIGILHFLCRSHDKLEEPDTTSKVHLTVLWSIMCWKDLSDTEWKRRLMWKECESDLVDFAFEDTQVHFPLHRVNFLYVSKAPLYSRAPS